MDVAEQRALRQGYLLGLRQAQADPGYGRANRTSNTLQNIPITEEDKEQLGVQRNRVLRLWKKLGILSLILSSITIIAGSIQMAVGSYFPYNLGAPVVAVLAGAMSFLLAILCLCAVKEGRKYPAGDTTGDRFRCLVFSLALLAIFAAVGILSALTISGVLGLSDWCEENLALMENPCLPDFKPILIGLSVLVIVTCGLLIIINIIGAGCYCNKHRAFGFVSGYEALMTSQTRMFAETQRGRHQYGSLSQQAAAEYQSDSGGGNQSMQSQVQPSAPSAIGEGANEEEYSPRKSLIKEVPPPSYDEVMMKQ